jgi:hypothetical protein
MSCVRLKRLGVNTATQTVYVVLTLLLRTLTMVCVGLSLAFFACVVHKCRYCHSSRVSTDPADTYRYLNIRSTMSSKQLGQTVLQKY